MRLENVVAYSFYFIQYRSSFNIKTLFIANFYIDLNLYFVTPILFWLINVYIYLLRRTFLYIFLVSIKTRTGFQCFISKWISSALFSQNIFSNLPNRTTRRRRQQQQSKVSNDIPLYFDLGVTLTECML